MNKEVIYLKDIPIIDAMSLKQNNLTYILWAEDDMTLKGFLSEQDGFRLFNTHKDE